MTTDLKDAAYRERDLCVALIAKLAKLQGWPVWLTEHDPADEAWDPAWRFIVFVDTPEGQLSWHIHEDELEWFDIRFLARKVAPAWDGHTTAEKYERLLRLVQP